jgi:diguanylate cyclase (GGDEF)-like protein
MLRNILVSSSLLIILALTGSSAISVMNKPAELGEFIAILIASTIPTTMLIVAVWYFKDKYYAMSDFIYKSSMIDSLTGAYNIKVLDQEISEHQSLKQNNFSIAMFDIDNFKSINDTYGHGIGDQALVKFSNLVQKTIRDHDIFVRYGGDEFVLLLPNLDAENSQLVCSRILGLLHSSTDILLAKVKLTVSVGICDQQQAAEIGSEITRIADKRMYEAKNKGKAKIVSK